MSYTELLVNNQLYNGILYAFKINPEDYQFKLAITHKKQQPLNSIEKLVNQDHAVLAINGGFFSPEFLPLGLRISDGKIKNPLKHISWWGVFYIKNNKAKIVSQKSYKPSKNINFAIQSGPRLIINGRIPNLKPGIDNRSALGITKDGQIIIVATENAPISTSELAKIMSTPTSQGGLGCIYALNLDGGRSTQLYAKIKNFSLLIPGFSPIADAILVVPKKL